MPQFPCPMGVDGAGVIIAVGSSVTKFKPGDEVCGLHQRMDEGTWAEVAAFEESEIAFRPKGMCWQLAAAVPVAGVTALSALLCCPALKLTYMKSSQHACDSRSSSSGVDTPAGSTKTAGSGDDAATAAAAAAPRSKEPVGSCGAASTTATTTTAAAGGSHLGQKDSPVCELTSHKVQSVLVLGASGGVGSFVVLLAKHFFRVPLVIATCSGRNAAYVRQLGADIVVEYTSQDVETAVLDALQQQQQGRFAKQQQQQQGRFAQQQQQQGRFAQQQQQNVQQGAGDTAASHFTAQPSVVGSSKLDLVIDNVGGLKHMRMAGRLLKPGTGLYVTSVPLADPQSNSFFSVLQFFGHLTLRKVLHRILPGVFSGVAFNGASPDGGKVQRIVDWLAASGAAAAGSEVETESAGGCGVRLTEFELEGLSEALAVMQSGRAVGKLVVKVNGDV